MLMDLSLEDADWCSLNADSVIVEFRMAAVTLTQYLHEAYSHRPHEEKR